MKRRKHTLGELLSQATSAPTPALSDNRPICRRCGVGFPPQGNEGACKEWVRCFKRWHPQHSNQEQKRLIEEVEDDADGELDNF